MSKAAFIVICLFLQASIARAEGVAIPIPTVDAGVMYYFLPDEDDLINPVVSLSWEKFYLEARYNYEGRDTGSIWLGIPFSFGDEVEFELTPMVGQIYGDIKGAAPGAEINVSWSKLNFYTEGEYVFDSESNEGNFFYLWSELTVALFENFSLGIAGSRTRAYESDVDIDRGPMAVYESEHASFSITALNLDTDPVTIVSAALSY